MFDWATGGDCGFRGEFEVRGNSDMSGAVVDSLDNGLERVVVRERNALLRRYRISSTC